MGSQDQFSLKWKDFHSNIATSFKGLREDDEFLDVTVCCDEERQLEAHKARHSNIGDRATMPQLALQ